MTTQRFSNLDVTDHGEPLPEDEVDDLPRDAVPFDEMEVEDGHAGARLSYVFNFLFLPFCLLPFLRRDNGYSLFHAKQALALWVGLMTVAVVGRILLVVGLGGWVWFIGFSILFLLNGLGLLQVRNDWARPLPLLGLKPQKWFEAQVKDEDGL
jgi:hypothetical protein